MKKAVCFLFALSLLVLCACDALPAEPSEEASLSFSVNSIGNYVVEDGSIYVPLDDGTLAYVFLPTGDAADEIVLPSSIVVPASFNGKTVTEISNSAFYAVKDVLESVELPDTIRRIGNNAFKDCKNLREVNLPDTLTEIGESAFENCEMLSDVVLPSSLKNLYRLAFRNCKSIKQITLPCSIGGEEIFAYSGLESLTIADGVDKIGYMTFCEAPLREVTLPSNLKTFATNVIGGCPLESLTLNDGLEDVDLRYLYTTSVKEVVFPASVTKLTLQNNKDADQIDLYFEGKAPDLDFCQLFSESSANDFRETAYVIHYHEGAEGFTSPTWNGIPAEIW